MASPIAVRQPTAQPAPTAADKWVRVAAYLIDVVPAVILSLVAFFPIIGLIFAGLLLGPYWLLRDITGASLGKLLLGLRVALPDGRTCT